MAKIHYFNCMRSTILICLFIFFQQLIFAQPKHEFRAVWVATVENIDWPSKPGLSTEAQKTEVRDMLDMLKQLGMNAVIFQARPAADAFYPSEYEPWSRYLTGIPGQPPNPYYDPLQYWIEESHKRGLEFHAWLNPYRVAQNAEQPLAGNHIAFEHPEWIVKYGDRLYFDPGLPETRKFVVKVVKDIVSRYDVDAIHFDDYFYPYPLAEEFPDTLSFRDFSRGFLPENKADWRRENVDIIINMLNDTIKAVKPWVKFGISPFGVWRNIADDPTGSNTRAGATNYDHLYADVVKWQKKGWIDYLLPQLYWRIGHPLVDFEHLAIWWKSHANERALYIGQAPYKIDKESKIPEWAGSEELAKQVVMLRTIPEIKGSAFFSGNHFKRDLAGFQDSLTMNLYKYLAIIPPMNWIDHSPPKPVVRFKKGWGRKIKWRISEVSDEMDKSRQFVIYLNETGKPFDQGEAENIEAIVKGDRFKFSRINKKKRKYEVRVSVLDRLHNESKISGPLTVKL